MSRWKKEDSVSDKNPNKISIEDVFSQMGEGNRKYVSAFFLGEEVNLGTMNCRVFFHKGVDCVNCGAKGSHFHMEKTNNAPLHVIYHDWHLNLYAINSHGHEVLMTKDHIMPRSKGGTDELDNLAPMCVKCNNKKGDKIAK